MSLKELFEEGLSVSKSLLFRLFSQRAEAYLHKPAQALDILDKTMDKLHSYDSINDFGADFKIGIQNLIRMLTASIMGEYRGVSKRNLALSFAVILYFLSPLDLVPDLIPFLGLVDDISLFIWLVTTFQDEYSAFLQWEKSGNAVGDRDDPPGESRRG